jgi:hypothetical protein
MKNVKLKIKNQINSNFNTEKQQIATQSLQQNYTTQNLIK